MSNFSQMMGNRSEAQRIYEQRKKIKWLEKKLKEKEKLNDKYVNAVADYEEQKFIISELENYLNKVIETSTEQERITCSFVLKYLQELKGSNGTIPPKVIGTNGEDGGLFDYGDK